MYLYIAYNKFVFYNRI